MTEQQEVQKVLLGDTDHFATLIESHQHDVARVITFTQGTSDQVEDLTQETFLRAFRYLSSYKVEHSFRNWLLAIAVNVCRQKWRRDKLLLPLHTIKEIAGAERVEESGE